MAGFNHFGTIADALHTGLRDAVNKAAFDIQALAQTQAPVDTGFLRSSIYTITDAGSTYAGGADALPPVAASGDDLTATVAVGASYGLYVEMGTTRMPARPYFTPAVEAVRPGFDAALRAIVAAMGAK